MTHTQKKHRQKTATNRTNRGSQNGAISSLETHYNIVGGAVAWRGRKVWHDSQMNSNNRKTKNRNAARETPAVQNEKKTKKQAKKSAMRAVIELIMRDATVRRSQSECRLAPSSCNWKSSQRPLEKQYTHSSTQRRCSTEVGRQRGGKNQRNTGERRCSAASALHTMRAIQFVLPGSVHRKPQF